MHTNRNMKDLRNHGASPHADVMDYTSMASDVLHFCRTHNLSNVSLLGHSMYGYVMIYSSISQVLILQGWEGRNGFGSKPKPSARNPVTFDSG